MNVRILLPCLACLLLVAGCKFSYKYEASRSTTATNGDERRTEFVNNNGRVHCSYAFKTSDLEYKVASNGRLTIKNGVLEKMCRGQTVDITATESGQEYRYQIVKKLTGVETLSIQGPLTASDEERIQRALKAIEHTNGQAAQEAAKQAQAIHEQAQRQAEAAQKQAAEIEQQAQRQAQALQKQAEALQKQAEAMQKQAEEIQRQISAQH